MNSTIHINILDKEEEKPQSNPEDCGARSFTEFLLDFLSIPPCNSYVVKILTVVHMVNWIPPELFVSKYPYSFLFVLVCVYVIVCECSW